MNTHHHVVAARSILQTMPISCDKTADRAVFVCSTSVLSPVRLFLVLISFTGMSLCMLSPTVQTQCHQRCVGPERLSHRTILLNTVCCECCLSITCTPFFCSVWCRCCFSPSTHNTTSVTLPFTNLFTNCAPLVQILCSAFSCRVHFCMATASLLALLTNKTHHHQQ